jgi:hypothetical protein
MSKMKANVARYSMIWKNKILSCINEISKDKKMTTRMIIKEIINFHSTVK